MNTSECEQWQGVIAMRVFGELDPVEETGLNAHLGECPDCRAVAREMKETYELLGYTGPNSEDPRGSFTPELMKRVLEDLRHGDLQRHRRRRTRNASVIAILLVAATIVLVSLLAVKTSPNSGQRAFSLGGTPSVTATVVLSPRPWGTLVTLREKGLPAGQVYTVSMSTSTGSSLVAGSYRSVGGGYTDVSMACAVPVKEITGLEVKDSSGKRVLRGYLQ